MAALRSQVPVGSAQWMLAERKQASQLIDQDVEDFGYSVQDDLEWLNAHMADIFARNQLDVADVFKTPGKLRGKTPRTARKRDPKESRAPLTDVFAPNPQAAPSPSQRTQFYKQVAQIQVARDSDSPRKPQTSPLKSYIAVEQENAEAGHNGPDDVMDLDPAPVTQPSPAKSISGEATKSATTRRSPTQDEEAEDRGTTDESFVSAKEDRASQTIQTSKENLNDVRKSDFRPEPADVAMADVDSAYFTQTTGGAPSQALSFQSFNAPGSFPVNNPAIDEIDEQDAMDVDGDRSPSDGSSPVKPIRNPSLTFASLPAREPLARISRTSQLDQSKFQGASRGSNLGRFTGGRSLGGSQHVPAPSVDVDVDDDDMEMDEENRPPLPRQESETTKLHSKTSTQRLHDRINMLGQPKESFTARPAQSTQASQPAYPQLSSAMNDKPQEDAVTQSQTTDSQASKVPQICEDDDDDWIAPIKTAPIGNAEPRPQLIKSFSADVMEDIQSKSSIGGLEVGLPPSYPKSPLKEASPLRKLAGFGQHKSTAEAVFSPPKAQPTRESNRDKAISVSNPNLHSADESTTPVGSPPSRKYADGPLSASKAKLYSVLKFAKDKFVSSAGVSAQAKMEVLSPHTRSRTAVGSPSKDQATSPAPDVRPKTALSQLSKVSSPIRQEGRRTRSSSEREQKRKQKEVEEARKADEELDRAREKERQKAASQKTEPTKIGSKDQRKIPGKAIPRPGTTGRPDTAMSSSTEPTASADEMPPPPVPAKRQLPGPAQKPGQLRRLGTFSKDPPARAKPAPVSVSLASQRAGRMNALQSSQGASSAAPSAAEPQSSSQPPKRQIATKASNSSLHSAASSNGVKSATGTTSAKTKALEAAKKKEQEERTATKRTEPKQVHRPEIQRKVTAQQRLEEQRAAQRKADAAKAAEARKQQEQRNAARVPSRQANNNLANALQQEKANAAAPHSRADLNTSRPLGRMHAVPELSRPIPSVNPAKPPPKRPLQPDAEDEQPQRPTAQRNPPSYQQLDAKRRKTIDEEEKQDERRSVMGPPIRQSNIRKEQNKFPHGYMQAPLQASHGNSQSLFKQTVSVQHQHQVQQQQQAKSAHPNDMAKFANGKIPFFDGNHPHAGANAASSNAMHHVPPPQHKTPGRPPPPNGATIAAVKNSPQYPASENIALPDIATDSDDSDASDAGEGFVAASWTESPLLRRLLEEQERVDPTPIFGPVAPLDMPGMFPGNKNRHKRLRDRTSSANWSGADRLTEEERRRDREGRERLVRDGGWMYEHAEI